MTLQYSSMVDRWGVDGLVHFPFDRLDSEIGFDRGLLPPGGALPADVPILFTANVSGPIGLFDVVELRVGADEPLRLAVLGGSPDDPDLRYALDLATGAVVLLDPETPAVELVNASFALFVEFLHRLDGFLRGDTGAGPARSERARALRAQLRAVDPAAFADRESWWSIAFAQLAGAE